MSVKVKTLFDKIIVTYVIIAYMIMFQILLGNTNHMEKHEQNILEVLTAAAPITILYIVIKKSIDK